MRKLLTVAAIGCAAILAVSCGSVFTKVQVKASPSLYAPLGGHSVEVAEYVSIDKIKKALEPNPLESDSAASKVIVYDYTATDADDTATFVVYYPLMDIPVDFSKYLEDIDLTAGLNTSLSDISFTVPELTVDTSGLSQTVKVPNSDAYAGRTLGTAEAVMVNGLIGAAGTINLDSKPVPLNSGETFKSAKIENGAITLTVIPTVQGLTVDASGITITLPGDGTPLNFVPDPTNTAKFICNLKDKTVTAGGDFSIGGSVSISGTVAAGTVVPAKGIGADISCSVSIEELQSATIGFDKEKLSIPITKEMPAEVTDFISEIAFKSDPGLGLQIELTNGLPKGMDVTVTVDSTALGIANKSATFPAQETNPHPRSIVNTEDPVLKPRTWSNGNLDITAKIGFPADVYDGTNLTVSNITPGSTYSLSGSFSLLAKFESAKIDLGDSGKFSGTFPEKDALDLSSFIDKLPAGVKLAEDGFIANIYLSSPQLSDTLKMTGKISMTYVDKNGDKQTKPLVANKDGSPKLIEPSSSALSLPAGTSWSGPVPSPSASFGSELVGVINEKPQTASLSYDLTVSKATITAENLESGPTSVKAEMLLKIPVALNINGEDSSPADPTVNGVLVDVLDLAGIDPDKDLFGRSQGGTLSSEVDKLLEQLKEMTIAVKYVNELGMEMEAYVEDTAPDKTIKIQKSFVLKPGENTATVSLNADELKSVITSYPFAPTVKIFIPNTNAFKLKKNGGISVKLSVSAVTDVDYTYELGGK
ncbi:hypothetical protein [Treponema brennaborense]|uniref:Lipoprotein n=1 Tax=Treponema brennaborense (strain DSM 12168 / CIP 105900 / DD5/3) TaxID=906968 RepID=F4LMU2_TREBD|nr:hypothetical protein [Treponema brennaborense]AEE17832.1 hypothetical protein Trebr_2425 [Treponema brennaborense DSM 12168]